MKIDHEFRTLSADGRSASNFFVGAVVAELENNADGEPEQCYLMEKALTKTYYVPENFPSRDVVLEKLRTSVNKDLEISQFPMFVLLQNMCHCCT